MRGISLLVRKTLIPTKLAPIRKIFRGRSVAVLDIGCGNESCQVTKRWLNVALYHGVDKEHWQGHADDYKRMDKVFFIDLDDPNGLEQIPDETYDVVVMNHVIEHVLRGYEVVKDLLAKLRPGGVLYLETPSERTINYPSAIGFLNFYDDPTHKKLYPIVSVVEVAMTAGFQVVSYGVRRDWKRLVLLSPLAIIWNILFSLPVRRKLDARGLWDLLGVANFMIARKPGARH
jgi:SAM-dependent methyltransferase